jgi:hypothetical protein
MADSLERAERIAKILSLLLIPVVLAIGGWLVNAALEKQDADQQYVKLALEILRAQEGEIDPQLRQWAAYLLSDRAPVTMDKNLVGRLGAGQAALPDQRVGAEALVAASKEYAQALDIGVRRAMERVTPRELQRLRNFSTRAGFAGPGALTTWMDESERRVRVYGLLVRDAEMMHRFFLALRAATPQEGAASIDVAEVNVLLADLQAVATELRETLRLEESGFLPPEWLAELPEPQRAIGSDLLNHLSLHAAAMGDLQDSIAAAERGFLGDTPRPRAQLLSEARDAARGLQSYNNMNHVLTPLELSDDWNERALTWMLDEYRGDVEKDLFEAIGDTVDLMRIQLVAFLRGRSSPAIAAALAASVDEIRELTSVESELID